MGGVQSAFVDTLIAQVITVHVGTASPVRTHGRSHPDGGTATRWGSGGQDVVLRTSDLWLSSLKETGRSMAASTSSSSSPARPDPEAAFFDHFTHSFISLPTPVNADRLFAAQFRDVLERQIAYLPGECGASAVRSEQLTDLSCWELGS